MSFRMTSRIEESRIKEQAFALCQKYLGGEWANASFTNFQIKRIGGQALPGHRFLCFITNEEKRSNISDHHGNGNKVLLRLCGAFCSEMSDLRFRMIEESLVCGVLAEKNIGPHLYGIFPEGRLEQFISHAKTLKKSKVGDELISKQIAKVFAALHKVIVPLCKEPTWVWKKLENLSSTVKQISFGDAIKMGKLQKILKMLDFEGELRFLRFLVEESDSPVVFCHNNAHQGNILLQKSPTSSELNVHLVDFQHACYNYRGFDIGNHFSEWMVDYSHPEFPYFRGNIHNYPSPSEKENFVRSYLQYFNEDDVSDSEVARVIVEADRLSLLSHFFWGMLSVVQEHQSSSKFGYLDYAMWRFKCYQHFKKYVQDDGFKNGTPRNRDWA